MKKREQLYDDILVKLCQLYPEDTELALTKEEKLFLDDEIRIATIVEKIRKHKCLQIAIKNMENIERDSEYYALMMPIYERLLQVSSNYFQPVTQEELEEISIILQNIPFTFIKGSVLYKLYPSRYQRYQRDIDVLLPTLDAYEKAIGALSKDFSFERIKVYFGMNHSFTITTDFKSKIPGRYPDIDLHLNPYYVWGGVFLKTRVPLQLSNNTIPPEEQLVMIIGHTANQWLYRMRDITDFYLLGCQKNLNWEYIQKRVDALHLNSIFRVFQKRVYDIYHILMGCEQEPALSLTEIMFYKNCFGKESRTGSLGVELPFAYKNYEQNKYHYPMKEAIYNTINMILFRNRAFWVNNIRYNKKGKPNRIIVLIEERDNDVIQDEIETRGCEQTLLESDTICFSKKGKIIKISSPVGKFVQGTYYGRK